jgi:hypothetical protein
MNMRFENFDLESPLGAIVLRGLGHHWDLHGFADFQGFSFDPERDELIMEWRAGHENPWGSDGNSARGCRLRFSVLRFLRGTSRDPAYPPQESRAVSGISKAIPGPEQSEFRFKQDWGPDEPFHLVIQFQDARELEIAADAVSLEAII